jgi:DNA-binding transcriptional MerR regulator
MIRINAKDKKREVPLPEKLFYKIGEVSRLTGVEPYVLRYWETEFPFLRPRKSRSGQRLYVKKDIELILEIKRLLYEEKYTIEGVRKRLGGRNLQVINRDISEVSEETREKLLRIKNRLREIIESL